MLSTLTTENKIINSEFVREEAAAPAVQLAEEILQQSLALGSSDIHLEPGKEKMLVRCRIDGVLQPLMQIRKNLQDPVLSRFKILAGMDIGEKRLPQDGRLQERWQGSQVDIRVSTLPTLFGESMVLRLLNQQQVHPKLASLGFSATHLETFRHLIGQPHGLFLVTGPTGSGKSTTLYAALSGLDHKEKKIITVEDPVEYQMEGISQVAVRPKIGLTFARCLRSILRQDPDIVMIGEIRDRETAEIAIQAALTGHLVFSTLHTNTAAGAVTRLLDMGVEPYLVSSALLGAAAQLLVRQLCPHCKEQYMAEKGSWEETYLHLSQSVSLYRPMGCEKCRHIGYMGRMALQELFVLEEKARQQILQGASEMQLEQMALAGGMESLWQDGRAKVLAGETSPQELLRVLGPGKRDQL